MANKYVRKMAILAKIETIRGTDPVPVSANAILVREATITPIEGEEQDPAYLKPFLGASGTVMVTKYRTVSFQVPFSGVAAAGDVPGYAPLLRACAMSMTVDDGVDVTFAPVSEDFEFLTLYGNIDGILHKMHGAQGTVRATTDARGLPVWQFDFTGSFVPMTDSLMPAVDYTVFQPMLGVNKANTTLTLHGISVAASAFTFDVGNTVVKSDLMNVDETDITNRRSVGSVTFRNTTVATKDWVGMALASTTGALALRHGQAATNVVKIDAGQVQLGKPSYGDQDGIQTITIPLVFIPTDAGNDEWAITVH